MSEPVKFSDVSSLYTASDGSHTKLVLKPEASKRVAEALELELADNDTLHLVVVHGEPDSTQEEVQ